LTRSWNFKHEILMTPNGLKKKDSDLVGRPKRRDIFDQVDFVDGFSIWA
jgi:hypothetical protein